MLGWRSGPTSLIAFGASRTGLVKHILHGVLGWIAFLIRGEDFCQGTCCFERARVLGFVTFELIQARVDESRTWISHDNLSLPLSEIDLRIVR